MTDTPASIRLLDTNVLLRYFTRDHPAQADRALALLQRVERGDETVMTTPLVIFEVIFTLQTYYHVPRAEVNRLVRLVLALPGLRLPGKRLFEQALALYVTYNISFADAYNVASMQSSGITEIYSWDRGFDRIPGITRIEPGAIPEETPP